MSNAKTGISIISERYAEALIEIGEKNNALDEFSSDLEAIVSLFKENKDVILFLDHPTLPVEEKKDLIKSMLEGHISVYILNFLYLLLDRNRISLISCTAKCFTEILNKKRNITIANVITAIPVDEETINNLRFKLQSKFGGMQIEIKPEVNPDIIAGMIVKIGDRVIDGSIRTRLENMKKQLV